MAQTIQSVQSGNWFAASTWQGGSIPTASNQVVIRHSVTFDGLAPNTQAFAQSITISNTLNTTAEFIVSGGTVTVGAGGISITGLAATGNQVQLLVQGTAVVSTTSFLTVNNQMPGNFSCKIILKDNAQLTVNSFSYLYSPTNSVAESQNEITLTDNSKLKVNTNLSLSYNSEFKQSQLEFYADDTSMVEVTNNFVTNVNYTSILGNDGIRVALGSLSVGSTASISVGNGYTLNTYENPDPGTLNTKNMLTLSDATSVTVADLFLNNTGESDLFNANRVRVMSSSTLLVSNNIIFSAESNETNNNLYLTGTATINLKGSVLNFGAGQFEINTDADITNFILSGAVPQVIPYTITNYENLTINNTSGVVLTFESGIPATISRTLTMLNGIVETYGYDNLILRSTASANEGSPTSYITGGLVKIGPTNSFFPVGRNGVWAPIHINTNGNGNSNTRFEIDYADTPHPTTTTDGTFNRISEVEYWTVRLVPNPSNGTLGTPTNATLSFYYKDACASDITNTNTTPIQDLILTRKGTGLPTWQGISAATINAGSDACGIGTEEGSLTMTLTNSIQQYGEFTFGFVSAPMPVTWLGFTAIAKGNGVELNWQTATELNTDYFEVQKSENGLNWLTLAQLPAAGFSIDLQDYTFYDNLMCITCYYRLKQVDNDGTFSFSGVIKFNPDKNAENFLFPNPIMLQQQTCLTIKREGEIESVQFADFTGRSIFTQKIENETKICLPADFMPGLYTVRVYDNQGNIIKSTRLLIK